MRIALALAITLIALFVLFAAFGQATAGPTIEAAPEASSTITATPTQTATPTPTLTPTMTPTPTPDPCATQPPAAPLLKPANNAKLKETRVTLRWGKTNCTKRYRVIVRRDKPKGPLADRHSSKKKTKYVTKPLLAGHAYYWLVKTCNEHGCQESAIRVFKILAPPTPTPNPTGPATPPPSGTPVPGAPPPQIAVYKGEGVYLNTDPNALYRFDCGKDGYQQFQIGKPIYTIALWFYPNERVTFRRQDFNLGQIVETATLAANGEGYVHLTLETGGWTPAHHYHLLFKGQSSGVEYCGHLDEVNVNAPQDLQLHAPHGEQERQEFYNRFTNSRPLPAGP